jgi:hypothetical protein
LFISRLLLPISLFRELGHTLVCYFEGQIGHFGIIASVSNYYLGFSSVISFVYDLCDLYDHYDQPQATISILTNQALNKSNKEEREREREREASIYLKSFFNSLMEQIRKKF